MADTHSYLARHWQSPFVPLVDAVEEEDMYAVVGVGTGGVAVVESAVDVAVLVAELVAAAAVEIAAEVAEAVELDLVAILLEPKLQELVLVQEVEDLGQPSEFPQQ